MNYGDIRLGSTLDFKFTTRQISGAPFTLAGSPVISAYPANSTTQLTAGITLTVDFGAVTGLNNVRVVASGGNGYLTATDYALVITTGSVNSVSVVGEVVGMFSIENRSALMAATAGRTLVVDAAGLADANTVKVGPSGSGTAQTAGDLDALLVTIAGYIDTEVAAIKAKTDLIPGTVDGKTFSAGWTLILAALLGKASGMGTTVGIFRAVDDSKDRITATVDADGNRTAVVLDAS